MMKKLISSILVIAMLLTLVPVAFAASDYAISFGGETDGVAPGATIDIPVYFGSTTGTTAIELDAIQVALTADAGLKINSVTAGVIGSSDISFSDTTVDAFATTKGTYSSSAAMFTLNVSVPATVGEYKITSNETLPFIGEDLIPYTYDEGSVVITVEEETAPTVTEYAISFGGETNNVAAGATIDIPVYFGPTTGTGTIELDAIQVALTADAGLKINSVTAGVIGSSDISFSDTTVDAFATTKGTYSSSAAMFTLNVTVPATAGEYKIASNETLPFIGEDLITDVYNEGSATITVDAAEVEPALVSIEAAPSEITVPYANQTDADSILAYVKGEINSVTAVYDDGSEVDLAKTDCTVTVEGATATVAYGEFKDTITLTLEPAPEPPVVEYAISFGGETNNVAAGATIDIPVYFGPTTGTGTIELDAIQVALTADAGLKINSVTAGVIGTSDISYSDTTVDAFATTKGTYSSSAAMFTLNVTVPATAGEYKIASNETLPFIGEDLITAVYHEGKVTITVTGGPVTPDDEKELVVEPAAITVPYDEQDDIAAYIKENITSAIYYLNDEAGVNVRESITVDENGLVTYNDGTDNVTFQIAVTLAPAPQLTGIKLGDGYTATIVVPYGEDAETYAMNIVNEYTVIAVYDDGSDVDVTANATKTYEETYVHIKYINQNIFVYITFLNATALKVTPASVTVPYGADVEEYVKENVAVKVVLDDEAASEVDPLGEISYTVNDATVTVEADGCSAEVAYTVAEDPSAIKAIEIAEESIVVPYANASDVAAYIAANITVTGTKNDDSTTTVSVAAENVALADGVATITINGCEDTIAYEVETITGIVAEPDALNVAWTIEDIEAYVAANVKVSYTYSAATANSEVPAELVSVVVDKAAGIATITVDGYDAVDVTLNIEEAPDYTVEVITPVYDLEGHKALVITMNVDGVPYVDGVAAVKIADKKFVFVTDAEEPVIEVKEETADIVAWGELHLAGKVTAYDALIALKAGAGVIADELLADDNVYVAGDIDRDWDLDNDDALAIIYIGLGRTVTVSTAE